MADGANRHQGRGRDLDCNGREVERVGGHGGDGVHLRHADSDHKQHVHAELDLSGYGSVLDQRPVLRGRRREWKVGNNGQRRWWGWRRWVLGVRRLPGCIRLDTGGTLGGVTGNPSTMPCRAMPMTAWSERRGQAQLHPVRLGPTAATAISLRTATEKRELWPWPTAGTAS